MRVFADGVFVGRVRLLVRFVVGWTMIQISEVDCGGVRGRVTGEGCVVGGGLLFYVMFWYSGRIFLPHRTM